MRKCTNLLLGPFLCVCFGVAGAFPAPDATPTQKYPEVCCPYPAVTCQERRPSNSGGKGQSSVPCTHFQSSWESNALRGCLGFYSAESSCVSGGALHCHPKKGAADCHLLPCATYYLLQLYYCVCICVLKILLDRFPFHSV